MTKSFPLPLSTFNENSEKYVTSNIHSSGVDLLRLKEFFVNKPEALVLDVGCGAGHATFTIAPFVSWVIGVDPSLKMLSHVISGAKERNLTNVLTRQGFSDFLDFQDKSADAVICRFSLHHWDNLEDSVKEINRVLKDDGLFVLIDTVAPEEDLLDTWLNTIELLRDKEHVRNRKVSELINLFEKNSLEVDTILDYKYYVAFSDWVNRVNTDKSSINEILELQKKAPKQVKEYFNFDINGDFGIDYSMLVCHKNSKNKE